MSQEISFNERALVGMVLLDPSVLDRTEIELGAYDWIDPVCYRLWPVLCAMRRDGKPIGDIRNVLLSTDGVLNNLGGASALAKLSNEAGMVNQDAYHLSRLTDEMERSRLRRVADEIRRRSEAIERPESIREWASQQLHSTPSSRMVTQSAGDLMRAVIAQSKAEKPIATIKCQRAL